MTTLVSIPLFAMIGLVTDLGYMRYAKMTAHSAAEAAAQAAIVNFYSTTGGATFNCTGSTGNVVCTNGSPGTCDPGTGSPSIHDGCLYAQAHGFASGAVTFDAGVSSTPPTAPGIGTAPYWITFRASQSVPQLFSAVLGNFSGRVVGESTAAVVGTNDCVFALDPTMYGAVSVGGTATFTSACGLYVNSNSSCAITTNGQGATVSATEYDVVGNVGPTCTQNPLTPTPNSHVAPNSDPLAGWSVPQAGPYSCDHNNYAVKNANETLSPGVYCGGISVNTGASAALSSGVYVLLGGGLQLQSTSSSIGGSGVTFYNTFDANHAYDDINIPAGATATLSAPNSGSQAGMLFFDDRNAPTGNNCAQGTGSKNKSCSDNYGGNSSSTFQGILYNKNNCINMTGTSAMQQQQYQLLVADCISVQGTSSISNNYSSLPGGVSPLHQLAIVE